MRVLLAGGGTAGHIEPALATADALVRLAPETQVRLLGTARGLETKLVPERGYPLDLVPPVPLPRRPSKDLLTLPVRVRSSIKAVRRVITEHDIDLIAGFGGYVALPAYLGARGRVPIVIHEANVRPGLANRVGARWAAAIAAAHDGCPLPGAVVVGMPMRASISSLDRAVARAAARSEFGWSDNAPTLLVTGGSQGARRLNQAVIEALPRLLNAGIKILHVTGGLNADIVRAAAAEKGFDGTGDYVIRDYLSQMSLGYAACDLALCRAGMMTVAETTTVGLPSIFVPLPIGNGEQRLNAEPIVAAGGAAMVDDAELTGDRLLDLALPILTDPDRLSRMSKATALFGRRTADVDLARLILATGTAQ